MIPATYKIHLNKGKFVTKTSTTPFVMAALVASVLLGMLVVTYSVKSRAAITAHVAGHGKGLLNLQDGRELKVEYSGDSTSSEVLRRGGARPLALAAADFDLDGAVDLVSGYAYSGEGIVTVQRGNIDAFAPQDRTVYDRAAKGIVPPSLVSGVQTYAVPEPADFLAVGDFNGDGNQDVVTAARGGGLYLLAGDGVGGLQAAHQIALPGQVTALTAGLFNQSSRATALIVGIVGPRGASALAFDRAEALMGEPDVYSLPAQTDALALGQVDGDSFNDVAAAVGQEVIVIHGQQRLARSTEKENFAAGDEIETRLTPEQLQSRIEHISLGFNVRALVIGDFITDRESRNELAVLSDDGSIRILQRGTLDTRPYTAEESQALLAKMTGTRGEIPAGSENPDTLPWQAERKQSWTEAQQIDGAVVGAQGISPQASLSRSRISARPADDLIVLDGDNQQVHVLIDEAQQQAGNQAAIVPGTNRYRVPLSLTIESAPVAMLAMPQKINGDRDLMLLQKGQAAPTVIPEAVTATFTLNSILDQAASSSGNTS